MHRDVLTVQASGLAQEPPPVQGLSGLAVPPVKVGVPEQTHVVGMFMHLPVPASRQLLHTQIFMPLQIDVEIPDAWHHWPLLPASMHAWLRNCTVDPCPRQHANPDVHVVEVIKPSRQFPQFAWLMHCEKL